MIPSARRQENFTFLIAVIVGGFAVVNLLVLMTNALILAESREIASDALVSVEYVSRISHDLDQKRILIDAATDNEDSTSELIARLAGLDADIARLSREYEPIVSYPGERETWIRLQALINGLHEPVDRIVVMVQHREFRQAQTALDRLENDFDAIDRVSEKLVAINHEGAVRAVKHISSLQRETLLLLGLTTGIGALVAVMLASRTTRALRNRDKQIQKSFEALETHNRELDAFAGRVAHDLRGPLATISVSTDLLGRSSPNEAVRQSLRRGIGKMEALIEDLLTLSRIGAQSGPQLCQTDAIARELLDELTPVAEAEGGRLRVELERAVVVCGFGLLRQALWNLGQNAIKYRRIDVPPVVEIFGQKKGSCYEFRVSDNGQGMTSGEVQRAFEPFFRSERVLSTPGTGLGLSIVKRIVEASRGEVALESKAGQGTTFTIRLPCAPDQSG